MVHSFTVSLNIKLKDMQNLSPEIGAVVKVLEAKNIKYELTGECTKITWCGSTPLSIDSFFGLDLGISIAPGVWVWFTVRGMENGNANEYWFRQRYNANVGKMLKGWKTECRTIEAIQKITGLNLKAY